MPEYFVKDGDEYTPLSDENVVLSKSELASKYEDKANFAAAVKTAVDKRFDNHVHKDKAHEDETVVSRVLEAHGGKQPNTDELRAQWESAHLKPVSEKLSAIEAKAQALESQVKYREMAPIFEEAGFDKSFVTRPEPGKPSPAEVYLGDKFELSDSGRLAVSGSVLSPTDFAKEVASNEAYKSFLKPEARNTSGAGRPGQGGGGAGKPAGLTQAALNADSQAKAAYILANGLAKAKPGGGTPFNDLPKK